MKVLVLSPHYDDAPLSLGQSLVDGELARHRVTVGVVFGRSNWTIWFEPTRSRWPLASAIRVAEESWAALRFRYRLRVGGAEEAVLRNGDARTSAFLDPEFDAAASSDLADVEAIVARWAASADVVLAPLGIGDHVDHHLVAEAARRLMDLGAPVAFYEDRPYAVLLDVDELAAAAGRVDERLVRRPVSGPMNQAKHGRIRYPSQFDEFFLTAIDLDESNGRLEHVWVLPDSPWPATATEWGAPTEE